MKCPLYMMWRHCRARRQRIPNRKFKRLPPPPPPPRLESLKQSKAFNADAFDARALLFPSIIERHCIVPSIVSLRCHQRHLRRLRNAKPEEQSPVQRLFPSTPSSVVSTPYSLRTLHYYLVHLIIMANLWVRDSRRLFSSEWIGGVSANVVSSVEKDRVRSQSGG